MNTNFKRIGLAAAVAAASGSGAANAIEVASETQLGDLGIVPYYTVMEGYATGINIINTSSQTQVIKFRFRRATDSMDALDFNVVLSPEDMYTGFISKSGDDITWTSNDNSCTVPAYADKNGVVGGNQFFMPSIYSKDAETGYVEIISMGSPADESNSFIATHAKHDSTGVPANCDYVRDNFFPDGESGKSKGVVSSTLTVQRYDDPVSKKTILVDNEYVASPDSLKISYFIKSDDTGVEFGNNAVHIAGFLDGASMTNQRRGIFLGDLQGFDHPDLNGGAPASVGDANAALVGKYEPLRSLLGTTALINDWSANTNDDIGFTVDTDWVVTIPGQYLMLDLPIYQVALDTAGLIPCNPVDTEIADPRDGIGTITIPACDFRDIPMSASFDVLDREEMGIIVDEGDLVVSPQPPGEVVRKVLDKEVNVIQWGNAPVLNAPAHIEVPVPEGAVFGWAGLTATSTTEKVQKICTYTNFENPIGDSLGYDFKAMFCSPTVTPAPLVGFVAWQRAFDANPGSNYGRIVEHSRVQSSAE